MNIIWLLLIQIAIIDHFSKYSLAMSIVGNADLESSFAWLSVTHFS